MRSTAKVLRVALPVPIRSLFDYLSPEPTANETAQTILKGCRVLVPFGNRQLVGIVVETAIESSTPAQKLKVITKILDTHPLLPEELLNLLSWVSNYYAHPIGETILGAVPPYLRSDTRVPHSVKWRLTTEGLGLPNDALARSKRQQEILCYLLKYKSLDDEQLKQLAFSRPALKALSEKGLVEKIAEGSNRVDEAETPNEILRQPPQPANQEQSEAIASVTFHDFNCALLHGVTGSGKTEVYLQLCAKALGLGKQVLVLVPEIGLSPQTIRRFKDRFLCPVVELHSDISDKQRATHWWQAAQGQASIAIGTRLAALTPMPNLGLIIVDEEHDASYKQQDSVRYSARDLSIYRAKTLSIPVVLGSATPSLETLKNALTEHYRHLKLRHRAGKSTPPRLELVDLKNERINAGLTEHALDALRQSFRSGNQSLVFLNRRGYAPVMLCHSCGWMSDCPRCSASMTLHSNPNRLHCHHCNLVQRAPSSCPSCSSETLAIRGLGTEQIQQQLSEILTNAEIIRIDRDSTRSKSALINSLKTVTDGKPCILVGTQMLAKGHHFPKLDTVIIVDADQGFLNPDFRAMEKAGQLVVQVAGRAGRETQSGRVLIQTHRPEHPLLQTLVTKGYSHFAIKLLDERNKANMPPFWHAALFRAESKRAENAIQLLESIAADYRSRFPTNAAVSYLGPMPCAMEKVQDRFRFQLLFKASSRAELKNVINALIEKLERNPLSKRVRWSIDIDPAETA